MMAQTIQIDSTFTSDGEIFPFTPNDTIYGLSISGFVSLNSDTSLVRVILTDQAGLEWMIYEAYPMIATDTAFDIVEECDETCYLKIDNPFSLKIYIENSFLTITNLFYDETGDQRNDSLRTIAKANKETEKIELMNKYNEVFGWQWEADMSINDLCSNYYAAKKERYGSKYNLLGLDYYYSGIYKNIQSPEITIDNTSLTNAFDWRTKHDANDSNSSYYDADPDYPQIGNGWMTKVKNQSPCGACTAFGSVAALEAVTNLFYNYHVDAVENLLLSERDAFNCSRFDFTGTDVGCICSAEWGKQLSYVTDYITSSGVVDDECFPWISNESCCSGEMPDCSPVYSGKCDDEDIRVIIRPEDCYHENKFPLETLIERLKTHLINNGPIICEFEWSSDFNHVMALVGFGTDPVSGDFFWMLKNSYGTLGSPPDGYYKWAHSVFIDKLKGPFYYYDNLLITDPINYLARNNNDNDHDGYYNWGIGEIPQGWQHPCGLDYQLEEMEDWNDNQNRIGPCNENFIEQPVMPEIKLLIYKQTLSGYEYVEINRGDLVYINQEDLNIYDQLSCKIENPGNAKLNLVQENLTGDGKVTFYNEFPSGIYSIDAPPPQFLCMNNETSFTILVGDTEEDGAVSSVRIWIDEDDIDDFEFTLIFNSCETLTGFDNIQGVQEWPEPYRSQLKDLHVLDNSQLTVSGTVILSPDVDIIVEPGGKLIIDGGRLTGSCNELWNGIDVWGDRNEPQIIDNQGMVEIINGGMIEIADTAVSTSQVHGIYTTPTGGIINCKDAIFKDNYMGICLYPYVSPLGHPNFSRFKRTQFNITDDYYSLDNLVQSAPKCGMQLENVTGLFIEGCSFTNDSRAEQLSRGTGLIDYDAGCFVTGACETDNQIPCEKSIPSVFEGLDYGIRALNLWSSRTISVDSVDFTDNYRGIFLGLVNDASINKNHFYLNSDDDYFEQDDILIGIYLERCNRYQVEENQVFGVDPENFELIGMHILNSGTDHNEIYNNSFENVDNGIIAAGDNRQKDSGVGLCIKCNDFTGCINDISVTPAKDENENPIITENTGIALWQGEDGEGNDLAAGNTFSENAEYNYINNVGCRHIDYTHHNENSTTKKVKPDPTSGYIEPIRDDDAYYNKEESCPSHLDGGGITLSQEKLFLNSEAELIAAYQDSLIAMVDGGNTEGLNYEVQSSIPEEALEIRQDLLDESPYLSDTVLISAIEKEDVLPGAMVRDVLIANPQAPKSNDVMNALNQRQDTIPGYMIEEILVGLTFYGEKELLEQELGFHIMSRDRAWSNLNHFFKGDTSNTGQYSDSLITLYQNECRPAAKYNLCFIHLSFGDSSSLFNTLSNIPTEFNLSTDDQFIHSQYLELFNILWDLKIDSTGLDSLQIQSLYNLSETIHSEPANYAFNLLISKGLIQYHEPVYMIEPLKSVDVHAQDPIVNKSSDRLLVFPNPAGNYFIIQYDLSGFTESGVLAISDIKGQELKQYGLRDTKNQVVIGTGEYSSGIYLIRLMCGKIVADSQKISIIR